VVLWLVSVLLLTPNTLRGTCVAMITRRESYQRGDEFGIGGEQPVTSRSPAYLPTVGSLEYRAVPEISVDQQDAAGPQLLLDSRDRGRIARLVDIVDISRTSRRSSAESRLPSPTLVLTMSSNPSRPRYPRAFRTGLHARRHGDHSSPFSRTALQTSRE